ncbi:MAG: c-type cytochrome [Proteobacteria bacterium]|nr:c-type cytochrome [Pseudomonadota bacterium]
MKKRMRIINAVIISFCLLSGLSSPAFAAKKAKDLYIKLLCESCHGKDGKGIVYTRDKKYRKDKLDKKTGILHKKGEIKNKKGDPKPAFVAYPKLAGQNELYLYRQMVDILITKKRNGKLLGTKTNEEAERKAIAESMYDSVVKGGLLEKFNVKDRDLKKIAKYLSKIK